MFNTKNSFIEKSILKSNKNKLNEVFIDISKLKFCTESLAYLPKYFCEKHTVLPIKIDYNRQTIDVVSKHPLIGINEEDIKFITGYNVNIFYANDNNKLQTYIKEFLESSTTQKLDYNNSFFTVDEGLDKLDSPAIKLVNTIFMEGIRLKASDIHIEPFKKFYKVRFRIDGLLREEFRFSKSSYNSVITRIKVLAKIDISEKRLPLDGRLNVKDSVKLWDFRVSTMPTISGEKIVIRIFQHEERKEGLNDIGLFNDNLNIVKKLLNTQNGIILVAGPTGSGKSTTLYTLIRQLDITGKNIVTIEDPVEQSMNDVVQINVNQSIGFDFASGLRSILRQDPDVIMVGEIRDKETASMAMGAAITGHMVFSTIHTFDCASVIDRLLDMKVEPFMIASGISGIITQRLARKICTNCKEEYTPSGFEVNILGIPKNNKLFKGLGCKECGFTGYYGRIGVFEIMEIKDFHKEAILSRLGSSFIKELSIKNGMKTLEESFKDLVKQGITTTKEILNICN